MVFIITMIHFCIHKSKKLDIFINIFIYFTFFSEFKTFSLLAIYYFCYEIIKLSIINKMSIDYGNGLFTLKIILVFILFQCFAKFECIILNLSGLIIVVVLLQTFARVANNKPRIVPNKSFILRSPFTLRYVCVL